MNRMVAVRWLVVLVAGLLLTAACGPKVIHVVGHAMEPTLKDGQNVFADTSAYKSASPKRGDVVVFNLKGDRVARIIGLPGETITFSNGSVVVNGKALNEPYLPAGTQTTAPQSSYTVTDGSYFCLNDKRSATMDSRTLGLVGLSAIVGKIS